MVSYNIYLLGPWVSKWPWFIYPIGILIIKYIPPNNLFRWIRNSFFEHYNESKIFKLDPNEDLTVKEEMRGWQNSDTSPSDSSLQTSNTNYGKNNKIAKEYDGSNVWK